MRHPESGEVVIYVLSDPRTPDLVRYVGRSATPRSRHIQHAGTIGTDAKSVWVDSLWEDAGLFPQMRVVEVVPQNLGQLAEHEWIMKYPRKQLVNTKRGLKDALASTQTELLQQLREMPSEEEGLIMCAYEKFAGVRSLMLQCLNISNRVLDIQIRKFGLILNLVGPPKGEYVMSTILDSYANGAPTLRWDKETAKFVSIDPAQNSHESRNTVCSSSALPT